MCRFLPFFSSMRVSDWTRVNLRSIVPTSPEPLVLYLAARSVLGLDGVDGAFGEKRTLNNNNKPPPPPPPPNNPYQ